MTGIHELIRTYREQKGLTQQELALKARVGLHTIIKYETGEKVPDAQTALRLSTVLELPASEFLEKEYHASEVDHETAMLIHKIGSSRAKLILEKTAELGQEEFLQLLQLIDQQKHRQTN